MINGREPQVKYLPEARQSPGGKPYARVMGSLPMRVRTAGRTSHTPLNSCTQTDRQTDKKVDRQTVNRVCPQNAFRSYRWIPAMAIDSHGTMRKRVCNIPSEWIDLPATGQASIVFCSPMAHGTHGLHTRWRVSRG
jgi:hypothetical protein